MKGKYLLPSVGWALLVLAATGLPADRIPASGLLRVQHMDKLVHLGLFMVFALLLGYGLAKQKAGSFGRRHGLWIVLASGLAYGALTELLQHFFLPGRQGSPLDFYSNGIGTVFGLLLFRYGWLPRLGPKGS
jgi:VanZ family protein